MSETKGPPIPKHVKLAYPRAVEIANQADPEAEVLMDEQGITFRDKTGNKRCLVGAADIKTAWSASDWEWVNANFTAAVEAVA